MKLGTLIEVPLAPRDVRRVRRVHLQVVELVIEDLDVEDVEQRDDDFARRLRVVTREDPDHWR